MTTEHKDKDSRVFTMFMKSDETKGEFVKMMEISEHQASQVSVPVTAFTVAHGRSNAMRRRSASW